MIIDRNKHKQFYQDEFRAETEEFDKTFLSNASLLLNQSEEMFVAQFITFREGEMIMKMSNSRNLPRKGEFLYAMLLPKDLRNFHNWGNKTYKDLYNERYKGTECVCIWHSISNDKKYSLVGFSRVDLDFAATISETPGIIIILAPERPPIDYIANLYRIVQDQLNPCTSYILDNDFQYTSWEPVLIKQEETASFVYQQLEYSENLILQGPPGTGKTYMIADLCSRLCKENKSILITALTNRALIEIASKPFLKDMLQDRKISKTNISTDEIKELPQLQNIKQITAIPGQIILSTYYITSGFAADLTINQPFDYVIMDEASQALTAMFAASKKLGKKNIWVGDINQLPPIIKLNDDRVSRYGYKNMINGLELLATTIFCPVYQLTKTYRFGDRAASYTNCFYNNTLSAASNIKGVIIPQLKKILNKDGGPSLILTDMEAGEYVPDFAISIATYITGCVCACKPSPTAAVLTCMKKTTRALQKSINQHVGLKKGLIIDTIARIQGLTTDVTILLIPSTSYIRTLNPNLFNVATSRAKDHTIIIAAKTILNYPTIKPLVRNYLERLTNEQCIYIPNPYINKEDKNGSKGLENSIGKFIQ